MIKKQAGINEIECLLKASQNGCFESLKGLINNFVFTDSSLKHALFIFSLNNHRRESTSGRGFKEVILATLLSKNNL